jgi:hypothetical protein
MGFGAPEIQRGDLLIGLKKKLRDGVEEMNVPYKLYLSCLILS